MEIIIKKSLIVFRGSDQTKKLHIGSINGVSKVKSENYDYVNLCTLKKKEHILRVNSYNNDIDLFYFKSKKNLNNAYIIVSNLITQGEK